jgi:hypothetical protein
MQNRFIDQRNGDRRLGGIPNSGTSMDTVPARQFHGGPGPEDRRWNYGIQCETALPAKSLSAWLENNSKGQWDIRTNDVGNPVPAAINMVFEIESDKILFVTAFLD